MPLDLQVELYLRDVDVELDVVRRCLLPPASRLAAFHLQQAAEKLVKAVRVARGLRATTSHDISALLLDLPPEEILRDHLATLDDLTMYATTYRYPTSRRLPGPSEEHEPLGAWADRIARLAIDVRVELTRRAPP